MFNCWDLVSSEGICTDPDKTKAIEEFPEPKNVKAIQSFIGLQVLQKICLRFFSKSETSELTKKNVKWDWGISQ